MKLISLIKKVEELELLWDLTKIGNSVFITRVLKYVKFLKQPLTLGMFVPCDLNGNVLEKPDMNVVFKNKAEFDMHNALLKKFKKAQERVLFKLEEGFEMKEVIQYMTLCSPERTLSVFAIHDLAHLWSDCDVELTPNAIKQLK